MQKMKSKQGASRSPYNSISKYINVYARISWKLLYQLRKEKDDILDDSVGKRGRKKLMNSDCFIDKIQKM